jgi:tetratricopeptide (TPR) repeat protein
MGDDTAADPLYERAYDIYEQQLAEDDPHTVTCLNELAGFYDAHYNYAAALSLYERAVNICEQSLGIDHPDTAVIRENYLKCLGNSRV